MLLCANAAGESGVVLIIKGVQNISALKDGAHPEAIVGVSPKGWITSEIFQKWLEHFVRSLSLARPFLMHPTWHQRLFRLLKKIIS